MTIRPLTHSDLPAVTALQEAYAQAYPGAAVVPGGQYLSPAFHGGQDVLCAFDGERLLAYAPLYLQMIEQGPAELAHTAWVEIKADPGLADPGPVKDALYQGLLERARALAGVFPGRPLRMVFEYKPVESEAIAYAQSKGFAYSESVFGMERDLADPIPAPPPPQGIQLKPWRMESEAEQRAYVAARNECFPEAPITLGEWQYFLGSPLWAVGTSIAAFDGQELAGNGSVYWNEAENARTGVKAGYTEYIFVRPAWRGKGIAPAMIAEGLRYLQARGLGWARLEVRALNQSALGLYRKLGYRVRAESRFYARSI